MRTFLEFWGMSFRERRHFPFWPLLMGGCLVAPLFLVSRVFRPFWGYVLRLMIRLDERTGAEQKSDDAYSFHPHLLLEMEKKSSWISVQPLLVAVENETQRARLACAFATFYLWNGRLDEARAAANFWQQIPRQWVWEHPDEARQALEIRASYWLWHPHPHRVARKRAEAGSTNPFEPEEDYGKWLERLREVAALDHDMVTQWRDSRLAVAMLDWIALQIERGELKWPLQATHEERRPFTLSNNAFEDHLARRIGMSDKVFASLWHKAASLDDDAPVVVY